uniref:MEG-3 (Grail) family n=1 Tax=Schistosoma mansoni TaxID=6183 RepID=A0A3Q0KMS0_SCHMA
MLFFALILIISLHSFDCAFTAQQECEKNCKGDNEYVSPNCGILCSGTIGPQTFYCYLGCSHNATKQSEFDNCKTKCDGGVQLTKEACLSNCGLITTHPELCDAVCGGNDGGSFPICLYNCDQEHTDPRKDGADGSEDFDKCKTKCYKMAGQ